MEEWDNAPANRDDIRMLSKQIGALDEALRRIEDRETETWAYRTEPYPWLRRLAGLPSTIWILAGIALLAFLFRH